MKQLWAAIAAFACLWVAAITVSQDATPATPLASPTVYVGVGQGHGSGVHIGGGLYVTAAHVVSSGESITIKINTGESLPAEVLWVNEAYDIALLKTERSGIAAARLDCSAPELAPGDPVEVIGNPLNLANIHTWGRVSRAVEQMEPPVARYAFIADITIAPGNSGGPAFDKRGRLVGIVVAMANAPTSPFASSLIPLSYIVPTSALCTLLGRPA